MLARLTALALLAGAVAFGASGDWSVRSRRAAAPDPSTPARAWFLARADSLGITVRQLQNIAASASREDLRRVFAEARDRYKTIEPVADLAFPGTAEAINGPAIERIEDGVPSVVIEPEGFQLLEQLIAEPSLDTARIRLEAGILAADVTRLRAMAMTISIDAPMAFDAARRELGRISAFGLTNADSPIAGRGDVESVAAMNGVVELVSLFVGPDIEARRHVERLRAIATAFAEQLSVGPDRRVDRLRLLSVDLRGASHQLDSARRAMNIAVPGDGPPLWRVLAASVFDSNAIDAAAFAPRENRHAPAARVELGRLLFFDPVLSGNGRRSCASCHNPDHAFADARPASPSLDERSRLARNAPSLVNSALQPALFHDLRTAYLEDQVRDVVESPTEMNGNLDTAVAQLRTSDEYVRRFAAAFPDHRERGSQRDEVRLAIAAYVRSLVALGAPVDRALRGDTLALSSSQRRGFEVFVGRGRCASCHFLPLTGGSAPPAFAEVEAEGLGVPSASGQSMDRDPGLAARTRFRADSFHFRTPSLRNVALTAPYMHNGAFRTLAEVIEFYNGGGGAGRGFSTDHQTLPTDSLHLSERERGDLLDFMAALTDTTALTARPERLPALGVSRISRRVGGAY